MAVKKKNAPNKAPAKKEAPKKKEAPAQKKPSPAQIKKAQQAMKKQIEAMLKLTVFGNPIDKVDTAPKPVRTLAESKDRPAVFTFGRMNPPTTGHEKLVDKLKETAMKEGGKPYVYLSHTNDRKKNPLDYNTKYRLARRAFGSVMQRSNSKNVIQIAQELNKNHDRLIMVVGADRIKEFQDLLVKYNGTEYDFVDIKVLSAGDRDPDASDLTGMSASKMRDFAAGSNINMFTKGLPFSLQGQAKRIMRDVRKGMDIKHDLSEDITMRRTVGGGAMDASRQTTKRFAKNQRTADADQRVRKQNSANDDERLAQGKALGRVMMDVYKERGIPHEDAPAQNMAGEGPAYQRAMGKFDTYLGQERRAVKSKGTQRRTAIKENTATTNLKIRNTKGGATPGAALDKGAIKGLEQQAQTLYKSNRATDRAKAQRLSTQIRQHQRDAAMAKYKKPEQLDEIFPVIMGVGLILSIPASMIVNDLSTDQVLTEIIEEHPNNRKMHERAMDAMEAFAEEPPELVKYAVLFAAAGLTFAAIAWLMRRGRRWMERMVLSPSMWRAGTKDAMRNTGLNEEGKGPAQDKYHKGMDAETKKKRIAHFKAGKDGDAPGDKEARKKDMPKSKHTKKFEKQFLSDELNESKKQSSKNIAKALKKKAEEANMPLGVTRQVFERGVKAWKTGGHRPGTTPEQWGYARVNSIATGGKTRTTADKDLWKKVIAWRKEQKKKKKTVKEEFVVEAEMHTNDLGKWVHKGPADYAIKLMKTFGDPDVMEKQDFGRVRSATWHNVDGFDTLKVEDAATVKYHPVPGVQVYVYGMKKMNVPQDMVSALHASSETIHIDQLKNEVTASCASTTICAVTLNFVMDCIANRAEPTVAEYDKRVLAVVEDEELRPDFEWWPDATSDIRNKPLFEGKTSELIKKSQSKRGAKGTLKAKIDGPITKEKVMALKNADDATTLDKKQANFWLNMNEDVIMEAEYQGKKVKLNDPIRNSGGKKKFRVYTTDPKTGNVIKVQFGDPGMSIKRDSDDRRKAFRSRHGCDALTFEDDRNTPKYWSCRMWEKGKSVSELD